MTPQHEHDKNNTEFLILLGVLMLSIAYAARKEYTEYDDPIKPYIPTTEKVSISRLLYNLENCVEYEGKTIKWRRTLLTTFVIILLFGIFTQKIPSAKDLLLSFLIIFTPFYLMWGTYSKRTSGDAVKCCKENIKNIKSQLAKYHNFILPSSWSNQ